MTISAFRDLARQKVPHLLDANGAILYSHPSTIQPGEYYILGLNPGGDPVKYGSIGERHNRPEKDWQNEYTQVHWSGEKAGDHPLQRNLIWLFEKLGTPLESVCASNLVFRRSQKSSGIAYLNEADACWPMHKAILDLVQPKTLLVFGISGVSPFDYLYRKMKPAPADWCTQSSGHGTWQCKAFSGTLQGRPTLVIGLPHLSRYSVVGRREVVEWIRALHEGTRACR